MVAFRVPEDIKERVKKNREYRLERRKKLEEMSPEELIDYSEYCLKNTQLIQTKYTDQDPVYDATLVYYVVPELIRRLKECSKKQKDFE